MTLELLEFFKRYIQDDLHLIVASYADFFDELVKDRLPFFKAGSLIAACPGKQIAAVAFSQGRLTARIETTARCGIWKQKSEPCANNWQKKTRSSTS